MADEITPPSSSPSVEVHRLARAGQKAERRGRTYPAATPVETHRHTISDPAAGRLDRQNRLFYWLFKHRHDYPEITVSEMVLFPLNWPEFRRRMGDYHLTLSEKAIAQGDWQQAFFYARVGTARSPHNVNGRVIMARLYLAKNRLDRAL